MDPCVIGATVCTPPRAGSVRMPCASVVGPNSSETLGARMSRERVARKRRASIGAQVPPIFHVVTLSELEGKKSLERL